MKRKSEAFSQALVGIFMVTVLLLLGYFTIVISGVDLLSGRDRVPVRFEFSQVGGLKDRDNVMYRGTKVGAIERVEVTPSNLIVTAMVDANVVLRERCRATVCNLSMLGGCYLKLEEGEGNACDLTGTLFRGETPTDWMEDVSRIARNLEQITSRREIHETITNVVAITARAKSISENVDKIVARLERGEGTVGRLLSSDDTVYRDLSRTMTNVAAITEKVNGGKGTVGRLIADDGVIYEDLRGGVSALRSTADSISTNVDFKAIGLAAADIAGQGQVLVSNLTEVAVRLNEGRGTAGRLINEDGLYRETEGLIKDARQVLDNYRDTTPISTFSSLATGAL